MHRRGHRRGGFLLRLVLIVPFVALLLIGSLVLIIQSIFRRDQMPGILRPSVQIGSAMSPTLEHGDFLFFRRADETASVGDIVSYRRNGRFALGRVTAADRTSVTVRGDAESEEDAVSVSRGELRGIWTGLRIPLLGYPLLWIRTLPGFLITVAVLFLPALRWAKASGKGAGKEVAP